MVDELVVGVLNNRAKSPLFSVEERVKYVRRGDAGDVRMRRMAFL